MTATIAPVEHPVHAVIAKIDAAWRLKQFEGLDECFHESALSSLALALLNSPEGDRIAPRVTGSSQQTPPFCPIRNPLTSCTRGSPRRSTGCSPFFGPLEMGGLSENLNTTISTNMTAVIDPSLITGSAELFRRRISQ